MRGEELTNRQVLEDVLDDRFHGVLMRIALGVVRDRKVAEEVVNDGCVALSREGSGLASATDPEAYVRVSVRNEARRRARQRYRRKTRKSELDENRVAHRAPPVREFYLVEREIPASLPHHLRPVYELWYQGMSQQEIAAELGNSRSTVKRRWSEILRILAERLGPADEA